VLSWNASSSSDVVGYRVYWGTGSGSYAQPHGSGVNTGSATGYTVTGLSVGRTYYFAVTAYDAAGNESAFSGEVSKVAR
jgi:fibronectin type 3 domain-containing protein